MNLRQSLKELAADINNGLVLIDVQARLDDLLEEKEDPAEEQEEVVIVRMLGSYGKAKWLDEAMENCLEEHGIPHRKAKMDAHKGRGIWCDDQGSIHHSPDSYDVLFEEEVKEAFDSCMRQRYQEASEDLDNLARLHDVEAAVMRHTAKIDDLLGKKLGL